VKKLLATFALLVPMAAPLGGTTAAYADFSTTYNVPGTYSYVVPLSAVGFSFVVSGGVGGDADGTTTALHGGAGGVVSGEILAAPGTAFTVDVGGQQAESGYIWGGAQGGNADCPYFCAGSGGGASDIRGVVIAGGGGGAGSLWTNGVPTLLPGGAGGYPVGLAGAGTGAGAGATTSGPGSGGAASGGGTAGASGSGTTGGAGGVKGTRATSAYFGGGGGGGLYGGGGASAGGGGGGLSWASSAVSDARYCTGCNTGFAGSVQITPIGASGLAGIGSSTGLASSTCAARGGTVLTDTTNEGVRTFVYAYESASEVDVCFRAEQTPSGPGVGGMVAITPTVPQAAVNGVQPPSVEPPPIGVPTIGTPTVGTPTLDANGSYCTTPPSGSPANALPGAHPVSAGTLPGGTTWAFDAYSDAASTAWVCVRVGTLVNERVVVPIAPPTAVLPTLPLPAVTLPTVTNPSVDITPGYDVTVVPDADTP
jgi:hypothetical protein